MKIDIVQIRDLAGILRDTDLAEIEIEEGGKRIRLVGQPTNPVMRPQQDEGGRKSFCRSHDPPPSLCRLVIPRRPALPHRSI